MEEALRRLYAGDFNEMIQEPQPDGSVIITLSSENEEFSYRFRVRDLYGPDEEVLEHEIVRPELKPWLKQRLDQAAKQKKNAPGGK